MTGGGGPAARRTARVTGGGGPAPPSYCADDRGRDDPVPCRGERRAARAAERLRRIRPVGRRPVVLPAARAGQLDRGTGTPRRLVAARRARSAGTAQRLGQAAVAARRPSPDAVAGRGGGGGRDQL